MVQLIQRSVPYVFGSALPKFWDHLNTVWISAQSIVDNLWPQVDRSPERALNSSRAPVPLDSKTFYVHYKNYTQREKRKARKLTQPPPCSHVSDETLTYLAYLILLKILHWSKKMGYTTEQQIIQWLHHSWYGLTNFKTYGMIKINWKEIHVILGCYESNRIKILPDWTGHISVYRLPASKSQRTTLWRVRVRIIKSQLTT